MWRLDTAWFFKNLVFHWHSKKQLIPLDNDDYWNPVDPCDKCPEGYDCINDECIPGSWPVPPTPPWRRIDPEPIDPENPTVETECRRYVSRGNGIRYTENNTWTWYDDNSWAHWTFKCAESITFYWRLNHTTPHSWTYLVNDIRWWVWNETLSFTVPENESLEQSIFKFNVNVDWTYVIEIKKKASWNMYYPWEIWEAWILPNADWLTLYMWVSALAEIWGETITLPDDVVTLYEWAWWNIIHNITKQEVTLTKANWDSITIMDRNVWATAYYQETWASASDWYGTYFQWWNNYWFPNTWSVTTINTTVDTTGYSYNNPYSNNEFFTSSEWQYWWASIWDWSSPYNDDLWWWNYTWSSSTPESHRQWPCPEWYHIPSKDEWVMLLDYWSSITWIDRTSSFNSTKLNQFASNTLIPLNGYRYFRAWELYSIGEKWFLWTTTTLTYDNVSHDSAYRLYLDDTWLFCQPESGATRVAQKVYWHGIRPFKNTTT